MTARPWCATMRAAAMGASLLACSPSAPDIPSVERPELLDAEVRRALEDAAAAVSADPLDAEAWGELGLVFEAHEFYTHARRCYRSAWQRDPGSPQWPYHLAVLAAERGFVSEAARFLEEVTALAPERYQPWVRLGDARLVDGDVDGAEAAFRRAVELAPGQPWGHSGIGRACRQRGDLECAVDAFQRAIRLEPRDRESAYALATALTRLGRREDAARALSRFRGVRRPATMPDPWIERIDDRARGVQSRVERATRLAQAGSLDEAEGLFREVLAADPKEFTALVNLGTILMRRGLPGEAAGLFERAVSLRPAAAQPRIGLAGALAATGELDRARQELRVVLDADPGDEAARGLLERLGPAPD